MRASAIAALSVICAACSESDVAAPVVAEMQTITFSIPKDAEFKSITVSDTDGAGRPLDRISVFLRLCDPRFAPEAAGCDLHGAQGTSVSIYQPRADAEFLVLTERPALAKSPADEPLVPLIGPQVERGDEGLALLRVRSPVRGDSPPLATTARGWPVVDCDSLSETGGVGCRFGFLIEGTPVVAQWFSPRVEAITRAEMEDSRSMTQAEVWEVASDIDARLRRLIVPAGER